jgi:hypothetical protein
MNRHASATKSDLSALGALRRFARPRAVRERCELCSLELAEDHSHLVEPSSRRLVCACNACALLFSGPGSTKYRRVPRRTQRLADFRMTDSAWNRLDLPIGLAFFLHSTPIGGVVAFYPSPAGATESLVAADGWFDLVAENAVLRDLEPDVEALLVNRTTDVHTYHRVGVDLCYKLVGLIRTRWRGLSGGPEVRAEIDRFFAELEAQST